MRWSSRRSASMRPPAKPFVGSLLVHGGVVVLAFLATMREPEPLTFITYEIEIVSPPPQVVRQEDTPAPAEEELVVETPDEPEPEPVEEAPIPDPEATEPEPVEEEPEPTPPEPEPEPVEEETPPAAEEPPEEEAELSGEDIEVRMEGLKRDFPEYYANIIRQIERCFRPPRGAPAGLLTTIYFVIRPDGTTRDLRFVERSGNPDFDFEALGAVADCAGKGRFGLLPEDYPFESLPVIFEFKPRGGDLSANLIQPERARDEQ